MKTAEQLYFAYGSNMDSDQMALRCPGAAPVGCARLDGYEFFVTVQGVASIREKAGHAVHGLVWTLEQAHLDTLDIYESVDRGLYARSMVALVMDDEQKLTAWVYIAAETLADNRRNLSGYLLRIVQAAKALHLPGPYLLELLAWVAGPEVSVGKVNQKKRGT
jgi:gamma-glutamylcyclotransferase (GGCT)/AIG2-like uncharacterized protein YtfP